MNTAASTSWLWLSHFLALLQSEWRQRGSFPVPLLPEGSAFFFFTGLFLFPQLSVGVSGAWGPRRMGDLQGDFTLSLACLVPKPWTGPPSVSPPRCCLAELAWGKPHGASSCCTPQGDLKLDLALCTSKTIHLDTRPAQTKSSASRVGWHLN